MSEFKTLIPAVQVPLDFTETNTKMTESLMVTDEEWEVLQKQHQQTLQHFADPYITSFMKQEKEVPFTQPEIMAYLQENLHQQNILMLASKQVLTLLSEALEKTRQNPLYEIMKIMGEMKKAQEAEREVNEDTSEQDQNDI